MEFAQFFLQPGSQAITCLQQVNLGINLDHLGERASSLRPGDFVGLCRALCCRRCVIFRGLPLDSLCLRPLVPVGRQIYQTMLKLFSRPFPKRIVEDILCFTRHHHWAVEPLERSSRLECADGIQPAKQFQDVNAPMEQPPATGAASTKFFNSDGFPRSTW